jgi:hypothetical protein
MIYIQLSIVIAACTQQMGKHINITSRSMPYNTPSLRYLHALSPFRNRTPRCYFRRASDEVRRFVNHLGTAEYRILLRITDITQLSQELPSVASTAATRVQSLVLSCGICDEQNGTGAGFLQVSPVNPHSTNYEGKVPVHYAMKVYGGSGCIDPRFLYLGTNWR